MQLDRDFVFAGVLDRMLEHDLVPIDLRAELVLHPVHDVLRSDRTERLAGLAGFQGEDVHALCRSGAPVLPLRSARALRVRRVSSSELSS